MREVIAGIVVLVFLFLIPGSAFAYWVPDYYGQGIGPGQGPGLPGTQGGYPGDNPGGLPGLPWLGNILSGIFGNPVNPYASVYGGYPGYYHPGACSCSSLVVPSISNMATRSDIGYTDLWVGEYGWCDPRPRTGWRILGNLSYFFGEGYCNKANQVK